MGGQVAGRPPPVNVPLHLSHMDGTIQPRVAKNTKSRKNGDGVATYLTYLRLSWDGWLINVKKITDSLRQLKKKKKGLEGALQKLGRDLQNVKNHLKHTKKIIEFIYYWYWKNNTVKLATAILSLWTVN